MLSVSYKQRHVNRILSAGWSSAYDGNGTRRGAKDKSEWKNTYHSDDGLVH